MKKSLRVQEKLSFVPRTRYPFSSNGNYKVEIYMEAKQIEKNCRIHASCIENGSFEPVRRKAVRSVHGKAVVMAQTAPQMKRKVAKKIRK